MRLLSRQLGIKNFTLLKSLFLGLHMGIHAFLRAFSSDPLISLAIECGWSDYYDAYKGVIVYFCVIDGTVKKGDMIYFMASGKISFLCKNPKASPPPFSLGRARVQKSSLAAEHAAAGNFDTAMRLLSRQLGIKNFTLLKSLFLGLHMGIHAFLRAFSSDPLISLAIECGWSESASPNVRAPPALVFNFSQLEEKLKAG
ncbi:unnamed protein product [Lactuca virosa]|uniref:Coatomer alpha subunit C-terminal domain-containing protein n=1 Tax=Lactuca virosa TaxID=75947 RepID=A0AAU9N9Y2_9ASTR|nr:unnamed protein product [Lactuca virosa]